MRLTLCTIARDEEAFLPGCLASVRGLVDRVVVVDTGSSDRTVALAEAAGARVVRHAWDDDFSAARNAALEQVREGYVLVLDADERLGPGARRALRKVVVAARVDCGMLPLHDAAELDAEPADVVAGRARRGEPVLLPRLLRRTPDLRWEGVVHESVAAWARGRRIEAVPAPIVHYGAVPSLREQRGKHERNLRLLRLRCERERASPAAHAYLCRELQRAGDLAAAREAAEAAWSALEALARAGRPEVDVVLPATLRAFLQLGADQLDAAGATLAAARAWGVRHPNLDLLEGVLHERLALVAGDVEAYARELASAQAHYERGLAAGGQAFAAELLPGASGWAAATRLGTVHLLAGEPERALEDFALALAEKPAHPEALLGRVEALLDGGDAAGALREVEPLLAADSADAWTLAAAAAATLGAASDARLFAARARDAARRAPFLAHHRAARLAEIERGADEPAATATESR